jgi:hypothetical protein
VVIVGDRDPLDEIHNCATIRQGSLP